MGSLNQPIFQNGLTHPPLFGGLIVGQGNFVCIGIFMNMHWPSVTVITFIGLGLFSWGCLDTFLRHAINCSSYLLQKNLKADKDDLILVYGKGHLHAISGIDGEILWRKDFASDRYSRFGV